MAPRKLARGRIRRGGAISARKPVERLDRVARMEFGANVGQVVVDGIGANGQPKRNLLVSQSPAQQRGHLALTRGQVRFDGWRGVRIAFRRSRAARGHGSFRHNGLGEGLVAKAPGLKRAGCSRKSNMRFGYCM